jgi:hypothetical protein
MTSHALAARASREDGIHIHRRAEDVVAEGSTNDDRGDEVCLAE